MTRRKGATVSNATKVYLVPGVTGHELQRTQILAALFNPDNLIHVANAILLIAFAVRDVLLLRIFFVAGSLAALGYYYYQSPPLWEAIGWTAVYILIHCYWIWRILLERRSVVFSSDEEKLYGLAFQSLDRRKFATLLTFGEWRDAAVGELLQKHGEPVPEVLVPISGKVGIVVDGKKLLSLGPGKLIGTALVLIGERAPMDAVVEEPCRYLAWNVAVVRAILEKDPDLRHQLHAIVSIDLAEKLMELGSSPRSAG